MCIGKPPARFMAGVTCAWTRVDICREMCIHMCMDMCIYMRIGKPPARLVTSRARTWPAHAHVSAQVSETRVQMRARLKRVADTG